MQSRKEREWNCSLTISARAQEIVPSRPHLIRSQNPVATRSHPRTLSRRETTEDNRHAIPVLDADDRDVRPVAGRSRGCAVAYSPTALKSHGAQGRVGDAYRGRRLDVSRAFAARPTEARPPAPDSLND